MDEPNRPALVQEPLEHHASVQPDRKALICSAGTFTYAAIDAMSNRVANALLDAGLARGDRVVIWLSNSLETVVSIYGVLKAGGVFVLVNAGAKPAKVSYILNNCQARVLIADARNVSSAFLDTVSAPEAAVRLIILRNHDTAAAGGWQAKPVVAFSHIQDAYPGSRPRHTGIDLDLATIIYTSGSTGDPKGVMCGHDNMVFASRSIISYIRNRPDDIVINVLPLSFDYGLYQLLMTFTFGGTLVLEDSFAFPAAILKRIEQHRVTGLPGVPTVFSMLCNIDMRDYDLASLRYMTNTAAALPVSHIEDLRRRFPHVTLYSMYGLTETKRTLYLPPDQLDKRPGSVGIAIPGTEVWLEDESGNRLGPNQIGELVIRGRHVMRGYWGDEELTRKRYRPGPTPGERVCYSGDLFRTDDEGYLYFVARKDDIIKTRGEKVAPKEVEGVLYAMPGVREAAVIGVPDPMLGQAVKAIIVGSGTTEAKILAHCRANLEPFMVPKYVEFRDALPRTSSGKVAKTELT